MEKLSSNLINIYSFCQNINSFSNENSMLKIHSKLGRNSQKLTLCSQKKENERGFDLWQESSHAAISQDFFVFGVFREDKLVFCLGVKGEKKISRRSGTKESREAKKCFWLVIYVLDLWGQNVGPTKWVQTDRKIARLCHLSQKNRPQICRHNNAARWEGKDRAETVT